MKKNSKRNLEQLANYLDNNQVINQQMATTLKGGNIAIEDMML